ncbi:MAG: threonine/serine dehydratase [Planctomycetota bacterium]
MNDSRTIRLSEVQAAYRRIQSKVLCTPCVFSEHLSEKLGCRVYFKAENLQHIGAFKARGALYAILSLDESASSKGVVTHSSGNHAAAVARAAKIRGIDAHIVMPHNAAKVKVEGVRSFGIEPIFCETNTPAREAAASEIQNRTGATLIHPFDNAHVIAGQGTAALEILEQVPDVDRIIAPVGGGGLVSGTLVTMREAKPDAEVYGAEPAWADDAFRSLQSGKIESPQRYDSVADGLRSSLGKLTFPIMQSDLKELLLVSEDSILNAMRDIVEVAKLVVEPSAAVPFAALKNNAEKFEGKTVVVILTGGNLDFGDYQFGIRGN